MVKLKIKVFGKFHTATKILVNNKYTLWKKSEFRLKQRKSDEFYTDVVIYEDKAFTYRFEHYEPEDIEYLYIDSSFGKKITGECYADRL